ncbi:MAG: hypothetical protein DMG98_20055 [Acidobacteria bacterium]|nr:MAG: hypothetical protein DMG98_20055 [Acidobacteriota bacterium]
MGCSTLVSEYRGQLAAGLRTLLAASKKSMPIRLIADENARSQSLPTMESSALDIDFQNDIQMSPS